jgi:cytochrome c-type biogenesis protein CcmH
MRAIIRERLRAGDSRDSIVAYFVARYGDAILIAPPRTGVNALIWVAPYLGVVLGVGLLIRRLRGRRPPTSAAVIEGPQAVAKESVELAPYYQEVDRALDQLRDRPIR